MSSFLVRPRVVIEDGPVGWHAYLEIDAETVEHEMFFEVREWAQAYARGLAVGRNYTIDDRSTDLPDPTFAEPDTVRPIGRWLVRSIVVEQLNSEQWEAIVRGWDVPEGSWESRASGVNTFDIVAEDALALSRHTGLPVMVRAHEDAIRSIADFRALSVGKR